MTGDRFKDLIAERLHACHVELGIKGPDYADRSGDRLSNFKAVAEVLVETTQRAEIPITPGLVWFVYFYKHIVPIVKVLVLEEELESEGLRGRFTDAINYLLLGEGLAEDLAHSTASCQELSDEIGEANPPDETNKTWLETAVSELKKKIATRNEAQSTTHAPVE